jgi:hypothetical protein
MTEEELDAAVDVIAAVDGGGAAVLESADQAKKQDVKKGRGSHVDHKPIGQ